MPLPSGGRGKDASTSVDRPAAASFGRRLNSGSGRLPVPCRNAPGFVPPVPASRRDGNPFQEWTQARRLAGAVWTAAAVWIGLLGATEAFADYSVQAPLAAKSLLLDGTVAGSRHVVVGERGHIIVSADGGSEWQQARVPTRTLLTAVHMHDALTGWAVGHDATILRTTDGGDSWTVVHEAPEEELPLLDVWFRDQHNGLAVGAYGYAVVTEDGGDTWTGRTISEDDYHLNALIPALGQDTGPQHLYIAAESGVIYRSEDGGESWQELPSPYAGSWFGGLAIDENQVLLTGLRGHLFRSEDRGNSWTRIPSGTQATLTDAVLLPSGAIVVTGLEGTVLTSHDGGRSTESSNLATRQGISTALPLAGGGVMLVGEFGVMPLGRKELGSDAGLSP